MKRIFKISAIIIIQAMLLSDIAFCAQVSLVARKTLSPEVQVNIPSFEAVFKDHFKNKKDFTSLVNGQRSSFILDNASELLTAQSIAEVEQIIRAIIQSLGFSRVKFYEVTDYEPKTGKWRLRQDFKVSDVKGGSDRYSKEGLALDEKEVILNQAKKLGQDIFHDENRWAHVIGDNQAKLQYVDPSLIQWDVDEFGDGNPQRVKEFLHIVIRNSQKEIVGILSADKWQKPKADDLTQAEPIFLSEKDKENKVKLLRIFARLGGIAIQRIRFNYEEKEIENFQEKEEALLDILHDLKNRLMEMTYTVIRMESKEKKKRIKGKIISIEGFFKTLAVRVRKWSGKLEVSSALSEEKFADQILQIIEETATVIGGHEVEKVSELFANWKNQLKAQVKEAQGKTTKKQESMFYFLQDLEKLAAYQAGLFDRQECVYFLHKQVQETWQEIEDEIAQLKQEMSNESDTGKLEAISGIFTAYEKAKVEYDKYNKFLKKLESIDLVDEVVVIESVNVKDMVSQVCENFPTDIERNITLKPNLPNMQIDQKIMISVLDEMIENSRKYGGSYFALNVGLSQVNQGFMHIEITTKGRGIAKDKWNKVFEREYRVDAEDGLGTGFGLDIARRDVERMGGKIWISKSILQNDEIQGSTTFTVEVPVEGKYFPIGEEFLAEALSINKTFNIHVLVNSSI